MAYNSKKQSIDEYRQGRVVEKGKLYDQVSDILFRNDPVGINLGFNVDEYEPEARTILPRLENIKSVDEIRKIAYEEFLHWFSHSTTVGGESHYQKIAEEIWAALNPLK